MRTIAIVNQKGGCGKTTTAINLGASLGRVGCRTLLVDLDPQGHCAAGLGVPERGVEVDTSDLLLGRTGGVDAGIWRAAVNLDLVPSRVRLAALEAPSSPLASEADRERRLAQALASLADGYDVCLLDCPPSIGLLTFNALAAADLVLIPVETGYFSMQGANRQLKTVRSVSQRLNSTIRCSVLPTLHEPGVAVAEDLLAELRRQFGKRLLPVVIHRDVSVREAASFGKPVCQHAPTSQAARDYAALASVLLETASLAGGAESDWSDVDGMSEDSPARPAGVAGRSSGEGAAPSLGYPLSGVAVVSAPGQLLSSVYTALPGEVVVTVSASDLAGPLSRAPEGGTGGVAGGLSSVSSGSGRAQELAARSALRRGGSDTPAVSRVDLSGGRPHLGTRVTGEGVEFVQPGALGERVAVLGSFSGWRPIELVRDAKTDTHAARLALPPGRHEYRLMVDGQAMADPYNADWVLSELGEPHSLVEVPAIESPDAGADFRSGAD